MKKLRFIKENTENKVSYPIILITLNFFMFDIQQFTKDPFLFYNALRVLQ